MKDFAKSIVCNTKAEVEKVGNGLKEDMQRAYPSDTMVNDVKKSATYEAIVRQPWKVYDILGVGDSDIKTYAFNLVSKKYGVPYDVLHKAWLDDGYKLKSWRGKEDQAQRYFQKLGVSVTNEKVENAYKPNPEVVKILEDLTWKRISADEARKKLEAAIKDKNIADLMVANPRGFIPAGNSKAGNIKQDAKAQKLYEEMMDAKELAEEWARATHTQKKDNLEGGRKAAEEAYKKAKKAYEDYAMNSKVGNGSGRWRGNFYEDSAGNSATVMKSGKGWEVVWEDYRGYGKSVGVYKDQSTAKKVAEEVVESEMPERIKSNYRSQAINSKAYNFTVAEGVKGNPGPQYDDMIKEAKSLISKIQQKINSYEKAQNINWGHVGDVEHYVRLLRQMV